MKKLRSARTLTAVLVSALFATIQTAQAVTPSVTVIHQFNGVDGWMPQAGLVQGTDGALYGTASQGGSSISTDPAGRGYGSIFRLDATAATPVFSTLYNFANSDGATPYAGLLLGSDGLLYGTTYAGGLGNLGTLFNISQNGAAFSTLYDFSANDAGVYPDDLKLTQGQDGKIYGATSQYGPGAAVSGGTIFQFDQATNQLTTLAAFSGNNVGAGLIQAADGSWYGTTTTGGASGLGSVYKYDPVSHAITTLHDFTGTDGSNPQPGVLNQGSDGLLYGTTAYGGSANFGTVFKLDPKNPAAFTTLYNFSTTGRVPLGGVTEGGDGYIYGTTVSGFSSYGYGTIYRINLATNAYSVIYAAAALRSPVGNLVKAKDGQLYGVAQSANIYGAVYKVTISAPTAALTASINNVPATGQVGAAYSGSVTATGGTGTLSWSATGLPPGLSVSATGSVTGAPTAIGTYTPVFTVTDQSGATASVTGPAINITDYAFASAPASVSVLRGRTAKYNLSVTGQNGFAGAVSLSAAPLPKNATATFTPSVINGSGASVLAIKTARTTPAGTYVLTVSANSGATKTALVTLVVR